MSDQNPYENKGVDIPDFSSLKEDEPENEADEELQDEEDYEEEKPVFRQVRSSVIVLAMITFAILMVAAVGGVVFGVNKKSELTELEEKYETLQEEYAAKESTLKAEIAALKAAQNTEKEETVTEEEKANAVTYTVVVDSINVRSTPSASSDDNKLKYSSLSDEMKKIAVDSSGNAVIISGTDVSVLETKSEGSNLWGKLSENVWIALNYGGQEFCSKK